MILSVAKTDLIARLSASGTINKQNGTKVELNEETIYSGDSETQIPESVQIYKDLVLDLPHIAYDLGSEDSVVLPFASHYMQKIHLNS
ncbi:MAG: hypothetical protein MJ223_02615 [Mycoplasmoidaceae bacterium]|nr:hypothetical protein [Mycoplasmoidaceae bacterium]